MAEPSPSKQDLPKDRPPGGLPWANAVWQFSDPDLRTTYETAKEAAGGRIWRARISTTQPGETSQRSKMRAVERAERALVADFKRRLQSRSEVIAFGHPGSVETLARQVPGDEWRWLGPRPEGGATFERHGRIWYRVLFYSETEVEAWQAQLREAEAELRRGLTLSEWAKRHDPEAYSQLLENWTWVHVIPSEPGEELKAERRKRIQRRFRTDLRSHLASGRIVLGRPPTSVSGQVEYVSEDALADLIDDIQFAGLSADAVYFGDQRVEIRVYRQLEAHSGPTHSSKELLGSSKTGASLPRSAPIERRGAPPKYDWDEFWTEVCRHVHCEGLPEKQADLENHMKAWCLDKWGQEPAASSIRSKISKIFRILRHQQ